MENGITTFIRNAAFLLMVALIAGSCNVTRTIPEGEHLLDKNIIKTDRSGYNENITSIIKQKPNRKILGVFRFHLGVYKLATIGKETRFKKWVKTAIGEEPVLLDTALTTKSRQQIGILFQNNGFFNVSVSDTTIYKRRKAKVIYKIRAGEPYTIRNLNYNIGDTVIRAIIYADQNASLLSSGKVFSNTILQNERDRITSRLRNMGYFNFNSQYIYYNIDSALKTNQVDVWMVVTNPKPANTDSLGKVESGHHQKSFFREVIVEVDYDPIEYSSLVVKDTTFAENLIFISKGKLENRFHAKHLSEHIFIRKDSLFSQSDLDLTYKRLSDLGMFRFVNIRTEIINPLEADSLHSLRCFILLSPLARQEFKAELEGTNSGGNFGLAGNLVYRNKNIFKGAETFTFKIKGGLELQQNFSDTTYESTRQLAIFNAYEIGPEVSLSFPRGLWPFNIRNPKKVSNPSTSITAGFNTQNRLEYFRRLVNLSYYYTTKTTRYNRFFIYPAEINYLNVKLDPAFVVQLQELKDPNIILGYSDQFIANGRVSYLFNNQELKLKKNYIFFRTNLEFAGNSIYLVKKINGETIDNNDPSRLFNVKFAQYLRPDFDFRFYQPVKLSNALAVFRTALGFGIPYGNSLSLPFEKSFYAGGPNDIRAWRTRQIGPGANKKEDYFERFGDLKITANVEYRFDIYRKLKGAAFLDAGNIWLWKKFSDSKEGVFTVNSFADQIAIGSGLGIRFDFTFFILRLDGAVKMKDPSKDTGETWVVKNIKLSDTTFNFGIGYPF
ncbi:MAG: BamA/TamA family outer membrane protein [Bacteroidia bacterium]|nr:BamA/TamA family outer membrane protein [Bacteroidia bacterium]